MYDIFPLLCDTFESFQYKVSACKYFKLFCAKLNLEFLIYTLTFYTTKCVRCKASVCFKMLVFSNLFLISVPGKKESSTLFQAFNLFGEGIVWSIN